MRLRDLVLGPAGGGEAVDFQAAATDLFHGQLPRFPREVETARARGERCLVVAPEAHRERLGELPRRPRDRRSAAAASSSSPASSQRGFRLPAAGVAVYGEPQLLPRRWLERRRAERARSTGPFVSSLRDLKVGDYVVHTDHGIGQFVALRTVGGADGARRRAALPPALRRVARPPRRSDTR